MDSRFKINNNEINNNEDSENSDDLPDVPNYTPPPPGQSSTQKTTQPTEALSKIAGINASFLSQLNTQLSKNQILLRSNESITKSITILNEHEQKVLKHLYFILKEFIETRESFAKSMSASIIDVTHLTEPTYLINKLEYQLVLIANKRLQRFPELLNPFPNINQHLHAELFNIDDLTACVEILYKHTVDPTFNTIFKERSVHCMWFTLYKSALLNTLFNNLIEPLQNLARMSLFSKEGLTSYETLFNSPNLSPEIQRILKPLHAKLTELQIKSVAIGLATNQMMPVLQSMINIVSTVPQYKLTEVPFVEIGTFIANFMSTIVTFILESEVMNKEQFIQALHEKIQVEFVDQLKDRVSVPIFASDSLYQHFIHIINQYSSDKKDQVALIKDQLFNIFENPSLVDEAMKLDKMKETINSLYLLVNSRLPTVFSRCPLATAMQCFIASEMNQYQQGENFEQPVIKNRGCLLL